MKISQTKIKPRISISRWRSSVDIQPYDEDNDYTSRVLNLVNTSGIASVCIGIFSKYISGNGFKVPAFNDLIVNRKRITTAKLLRQISKDYARWHGFAIHVNYNLLGQITEANYLSFNYCRLKKADDLGYVSKIAVNHCWVDKRFKAQDVKFIDVFNPDPEIVQLQIAAAGGIDKYNGQVLWYSSEGDDYPLAPYDSVLEDIESEGRTKNFKRKLIATGYVAGGTLSTGKFQTEDERTAFNKNFEDYQGDDNAGNIMHVEVESEEERPKFEPFKMIENDTIYSYTESSTQENIRTVFGIPSPLIGKDIAGKLGMSQMVADAIVTYNLQTEDERKMMSEIFFRIFSHWHKEVNPGDDYSIMPLNNIKDAGNVPISLFTDMSINERRSLIGLPELDETQADKKRLIETLGVGSVQSVIVILTDVTLTPEQKKGTLMVMGFTQDEVNQMLPESPEPVVTPPPAAPPIPPA